MMKRIKRKILVTIIRCVMPMLPFNTLKSFIQCCDENNNDENILKNLWQNVFTSVIYCPYRLSQYCIKFPLWSVKYRSY